MTSESLFGIFDTAVMHVREAVWTMRTPEDISHVLTAIKTSLESMELPYFSCSLSVVEPDAETPVVQFWATTHNGQWLKEETQTSPDHPILKFIQHDDPVHRPDLETDDPYNEKEAVQKGYGLPIRGLLDVPYSLGTFSLSSLEPNAFTPEHTRFLQMLLPYFEDGINRLKDLETLKRRNQELERLNDELDNFSAVASHDLRAPLRRIHQFADLLRHRHRSNTPEKTDSQLERIIEQAQSMSTLVENLLAYARVGRMDTPLEPVSLTAVLEKTLDNLADTIDAKHARITADPLPTIWGEPVTLVQLFQNLIENGLKYQGKKTPEIHITAAKKADWWQIGVRDNGIGIEPEFIAGIFAPFKRLHTQQAFEGSGLGLATCARIVANHAGKIWVESTPGEGSVFYCTFKNAAPLSAALTAPGASPQPLALPPLRILLAEDDPASQMLAEAMLKKLGLNVTTASTGEEALQAFDRADGHFDALILDMQMPVWNGIEVTRQIREKEKLTTRKTPVFALTARSNDEEAAFLAMGFDGFLTKPLKEDRLRTLLNGVHPS